MVSVLGLLPPVSPAALLQQETEETVAANSAGCVTCHTATDSPTMHETGTVLLGCTDCHGGQVRELRPVDALPGDAAYEETRRRAHVLPAHPERWPTSANPERSYAALEAE